MTENGESFESVYTRDIIDEIFGVVDIYEGFDRFLTGLVSDAVIENWKAYAYDWRYSVIDIAERGTQYENEIRSALTEIEVLAEDSFSGKVTIIGHSNGGLLAKAIMERLAAQGKTALVDRVIFIGTPQLGTPKAIPTILHGYDQGAAGGLIINEATVRDIVGSMPGALALVPSQKYFDEDPGLLVTFDTSDSTAFLRTAYGNAINNESELLAFMRGEDGRPANPESIEEPVIANGTLLEEVLEDHARLFDVWSAPEGVEVIEVVGVGLNTLRGIEYREFVTRECTNEGFQGQQCVDIPYYKAIPQFTQYGDGTVVGYSAEGYEGEKRRFYFDLKRSRQLGEIVEHANITNASFLQRLIANVISNEDSTVEAISESLPEFVTDTILIGVHSPLNIIVTDGRGNTIERGAGDYPIESIGGGEYLEFAGGKYVLIPKDGEYDIKLEGTGTGSATFTLESLEGDSRKTLVDVRIATITPNTTIAAEYSEVGLSNLSIDQDGDGDIDIEMTPAGEIINTSVSYDDLLKGIAALPLRNVQKNILIAQVRIAAELEKLAVKKPKLAKLEIVALRNLEASLKLLVRKKQLTQGNIEHVLQIIDKLKV
jgi:pimeloyl-ACP methyl ester carboxylesterase